MGRRRSDQEHPSLSIESSPPSPPTSVPPTLGSHSVSYASIPSVSPRNPKSFVFSFSFIFFFFEFIYLSVFSAPVSGSVMKSAASFSYFDTKSKDFSKRSDDKSSGSFSILLFLLFFCLIFLLLFKGAKWIVWPMLLFMVICINKV